ncbi:hypothetical protein DCAR_0521901 [Daucus carota subsp. sativus]|uniref:Uncharacterized protein n=1 Tax=Daucus carota subsp. sativus TaxID=79200 RepID=A0A164ZGK3_DAUCS|nr:hypothetical protein DCAR_0521901 [Daucus carota subsp. sativus]
MAFSNTVFPRIPLHNQVTDEEPTLFHTIDRMLTRKLIRSLNRNSTDAIDVVAFLLWLEKDKLSVNGVYKVLTEWPNHLVGMLADQVLALLEWLRNDVLVWERRGDISLIQELCQEVLSFINLHQRRFEIMQGKDQIKGEMAERAFRETFPGESYENRNVQDHVGLGNGAGAGVGNTNGGVGYDSRNNSGVHERGLGAGGTGNIGPREVLRNNIGRAGLGIGNRFGVQNVAGGSRTGVHFGNIGGHHYGPRSFGVQLGAPHLRNINLGRAGFNASQRYIHDPRRIMNENRYGVGYGVRSAPVSPVPQTVHRFVPHPLHYAMNPNVPRSGTRDDIVLGYQQPENMNDGGSAVEPSLNNVPYGPRMGHVDSNGDQVNTRSPIAESELAVLLRGLNITDEETDVHEDDRTVFLTFSRGYPLTESDIWGFFTRKKNGASSSRMSSSASTSQQPDHEAS